MQAALKYANSQSIVEKLEQDCARLKLKHSLELKVGYDYLTKNSLGNSKKKRKWFRSSHMIKIHDCFFIILYYFSFISFYLNGKFFFAILTFSKLFLRSVRRNIRQ